DRRVLEHHVRVRVLDDGEGVLNLASGKWGDGLSTFDERKDFLHVEAIGIDRKAVSAGGTSSDGIGDVVLTLQHGTLAFQQMDKRFCDVAEADEGEFVHECSSVRCRIT